MEFSSFYIFLSFLLSLNHQPSNCQQTYPNETQLECEANPSVSKGYLCNGPQTSCQSFLTFRSRSPYDSPTTIASLLGSETSSISLINNMSSDATIAADKLIMVPVPCTCFGNIYQHFAPYTVKKNDTYYSTAREVYQGLTTCQAMINQNYYDSTVIPVGAQLSVPLRCACPSFNQTANGVISLVSYLPTEGDTLTKIGELFGGVGPETIMEANTMSPNTSVQLFTPVLVPLKSQNCSIRPQSFFCQCPNGEFAYENKNGYACSSDDKDSKGFQAKLVIIIGFGIGITFLSLVLLCYHFYKYLKKRKNKIRQEKFFKQNGGFLLQQHFSSYGSSDRTKLFSEDELQRATDNYNECRILGQGGYGTVYKGMLLDGGIVAIKRSKVIDRSRIDQFINEIVILSQINHRNVVKLLGCCLETEFPILVYEYISNGTLARHIHEQDQESSLSWEDRLRVAAEVAGAIAYMHSAASTPIYHRDIKSSNILLDDKYCAKVSDFGTSRSVPFEKTHLTTGVQGTFGYFDPEYFQSGQYTEKSDVYSFGVVLIELLTGQKPISFTRAEEERNLVAYFSSAKEERLFQILDPRVAREAGQEDIQAIANLAIRCVRLSGKKRPTMKEIALELEALRKCQRSLQISRSSQQFDVERTSGHTAASESMEEYIDDSFGMTTSI